MRRLIFILFVFLAIFAIFIFIRSEKTLDPNPSSPAMASGNGAVINIWIDSFSRLDVLKAHGVRYLFVDVGDTAPDGSLETSDAEIKNFLFLISNYEGQRGYDFVLLPYSEVIASKYNISSEVFAENFLGTYARLKGLGFDGVLVDIENLESPEERASYLSLLGGIRERLPNSIISVYAGHISGLDTGWTWSPDFYRSVSDRADIISASAYDSGIEDDEEYRSYIRDQVSVLASQNFSSYFLFAVPTHKDAPETIENALIAYSEEIKKYPPNRFLGVCVFAEWTADKSEWESFEKYANDYLLWTT